MDTTRLLVLMGTHLSRPFARRHRAQRIIRVLFLEYWRMHLFQGDLFTFLLGLPRRTRRLPIRGRGFRKAAVITTRWRSTQTIALAMACRCVVFIHGQRRWTMETH